MGLEVHRNVSCSEAEIWKGTTSISDHSIDKLHGAYLKSGTLYREDNFKMADPILRKKDGDITTITLNRPETGNRQTDATWAQVTEMFDAASKDSRLIIFRGAGEDFCMGREAMGQAQSGPAPEAYAVRDRADTIFNLYGAFRNSKAPIL